MSSAPVETTPSDGKISFTIPKTLISSSTYFNMYLFFISVFFFFFPAAPAVEQTPAPVEETTAAPAATEEAPTTTEGDYLSYFIAIS
jgi:hypothetical protein